MAAVTSRAYDLDASGAATDGGLAIVRVKPINAGGGGVERSGAGLADGEGALRFGGDLRGIRVMTRAGAGGRDFKYPSHVIPPSLDNAGLFDQFLPCRIDAFFEGVDVNVMCYGQTGTGKTHTIFGTPGIMSRAGRGEYGHAVTLDYGIFPRTLLAVFARAQALGDSCVVTCSAIELDMVNGNKCMFSTTRVRRSQGLSSPHAFGVTIDKTAKPARMYGMKELVLESEEDILRVFAAIATRNTAGTGMNDNSSRTHCFVAINLHVAIPAAGDIAGGARVRSSRFQFVDLAGSERLKDSAGTTNPMDSATALQGMCTNFSLTELGTCLGRVHEHNRKMKKKTGKAKKPFSVRFICDLVSLLEKTITGSAASAVFVCVSLSPFQRIAVLFRAQLWQRLLALSGDSASAKISAPCEASSASDEAEAGSSRETRGGDDVVEVYSRAHGTET